MALAELSGQPDADDDMSAQLDLALAERDKGIARVKAKNSDFVETMKSVARMIARKNGTVCADDLREWLKEHPEVGEPTSYSAMGAIFCRNKDFKLVGYSRSALIQGHGNLQRIGALRATTI